MPEEHDRFLRAEADWFQTKERIGQQVREYYRACTTEELPPRLIAIVKKLDEKANRQQTNLKYRDIEN
jgi:hypothetical protein